MIKRWISVEETLPKVCYEKILALDSGAVCMGHLSKRRPNPEWSIADQEHSEAKVTHWMNPPEHPGKNEKE